jgi:endonuclease/exonuclease/phosphatase family metal-dependent hydrolase
VGEEVTRFSHSLAGRDSRLVAEAAGAGALNEVCRLKGDGMRQRFRATLGCAWVALVAIACGPPAEPEHAGQKATPLSEDAAAEAGPGPRTAAREIAFRLKVATWNLEWLNRANNTGMVKRQDADYARLKGYADRLQADVVAVEEVDGEPALSRVFDAATYDYHVAGQNGVQVVGFAYRKGLEVTENPDYGALDVGDVRSGVDITVTAGDHSLRILAVHLKSGCFSNPLTNPQGPCVKLAQQLPILEQWIDARAAAREPFLVLGDFNRRMKTGEVFYSEIDDGEPASADLELVTDGKTSDCWGGEFPEFVDHIVLSRDAAPLMQVGSFAVQTYDATDAQFKSKLSDHCPVSIVLGSETDVDPEPGAQGPIKGNINSRGDKLYHLPSCPSYAETEVDGSRGERWFETEAEASAAGWRKAGNCP